jgi:CBS domain-containing protein
MNANQIMTHPVVSAPIESTLGLVARLMWEYDCGIVPIVDDRGRLAGVITDRDVCMAAYTQGQPLGAMAVTSAMAKDVVSCRATDTLESVQKRMRDYQVRRVPVVDAANRPIGIISLNDIAQRLAGEKRGAADRALVQTLAIVGRPRVVQADNVSVTPAA